MGIMEKKMPERLSIRAQVPTIRDHISPIKGTRKVLVDTTRMGLRFSAAKTKLEKTIPGSHRPHTSLVVGQISLL